MLGRNSGFLRGTLSHLILEIGRDADQIANDESSTGLTVDKHDGSRLQRIDFPFSETLVIISGHWKADRRSDIGFGNAHSQ